MGMRLGTFDNGILKAPDGTVIGIALGADYCAEHEWGIEELKHIFGITEKGYGIERRTITKVPTEVKNGWGDTKSYVRLIDTKKNLILLVYQHANDETFDIKNHLIHRPPKSYYGDRLITAWDGKSFGISAATKEDREALMAIYDAMMRKDLAIWTGGGGIFKNPGLVLAIASLVPADNAQILYDADVDREKLEKAVIKTGIVKKLERAELEYLALSPKWASSISGDGETKYSVVFWLNPMDQRLYNHGWFTVEQLEQWIKGEGPIPQKRAVA